MKLKGLLFILFLVSCKSFFTEPEKPKYATIHCHLIFEYGTILKYAGKVEMIYGDVKETRLLSCLRVDFGAHEYIYDCEFGKIEIIQDQIRFNVSMANSAWRFIPQTSQLFELVEGENHFRLGVANL